MPYRYFNIKYCKSTYWNGKSVCSRPHASLVSWVYEKNFRIFICSFKIEGSLKCTAKKKELERRSKIIHSDIPDEFPRKLRSIKEWNNYKAVEYKFFIQYAAAVLFKKILDDDLYNHLLLFALACRLVSNKTSSDYVNLARKYFTSFVEKASMSSFYGPTFMSLNVHNLIHICDDVMNMNCNLNELSAFDFESYLGEISSVLRSPINLVSQYCRRIHEKEKFIEKPMLDTSTVVILQEKMGKVIKIRCREMILSSSHPNSTVLLQDRSVAEIINIYKHDSYRATVKQYLKKKSIFTDPCDSSNFNMWQVNDLSSRILDISLSFIYQKCVKFQMNYSAEEEKKFFVIPLLH